SAAGLEDVGRLGPQRPRLPAPHRTAAQPFVLEQAERAQVLERADLLARVEVELEQRVLAGRGVHPEGAAGLGVEVPLDDLADVGVELGLRVLGCDAHVGRSSPKRIFQLSVAISFRRGAARKSPARSLNLRTRTSLSSWGMRTRRSSRSLSRALNSLL